jgi:hypothetical protein
VVTGNVRRTCNNAAISAVWGQAVGRFVIGKLCLWRVYACTCGHVEWPEDGLIPCDFECSMPKRLVSNCSDTFTKLGMNFPPWFVDCRTIIKELVCALLMSCIPLVRFLGTNQEE